MELEKIADGLTKSAAAARTLGPIVKPGQYAAWAQDLKKVAEAHYASIQTEKKAEEPAAGNFLTNTFNTLKENYKNLDPALQNTITGAGLGLGGGALMGLGSNLFSGRKKKNYLSDMLSMGLMGGLGGGAAGGLYSLATDPGVIERGANALGIQTTPGAAQPAAKGPDLNTTQGRTDDLRSRMNATGINAYTTDKLKQDAITGAAMAGGGAATGAALSTTGRVTGASDPTRVTPNRAALVETVNQNIPSYKNVQKAPTMSQLVSSHTGAIDNTKKLLGFNVDPTSGKVVLDRTSPLLAATGGNRAAAEAAAQSFINARSDNLRKVFLKSLLDPKANAVGTKVTIPGSTHSITLGQDKAVNSALQNNPITVQERFNPNAKQLLSGLKTNADIQRTFGYAVGKNGKITLNPNSPLLSAFSNPAEASDIATQLEKGTLAERQALAKQIMRPGFFSGKHIPLTDAGLTTDAQKAYREANPRVLKTDTIGQAAAKRLKSLSSGITSGARAAKLPGILGAGAGGLHMLYNAVMGATSDAERGKIMSDEINNLLSSNQITNPAQLQELQNMASSASQGLSQAGADFFAQKYQNILQNAQAGK